MTRTMRMRNRTKVVALGGALLLHSGVVGAAPCAGFADVSDTDAFCTSIVWMKNRAITLGCGDGSNYCPDDYVTRKQMAAFMYRLGFQNAFLQNGNTFGQPAFFGTTDAQPINFLVNSIMVGGINEDGLHMINFGATGTVPAIDGVTNSQSVNAVGVKGLVSSQSPGPGSAGVLGVNQGTDASGHGYGVMGQHAGAGKGVYGTAVAGTGVMGVGTSPDGRGVQGNAPSGMGVVGFSVSGIGLIGYSTSGRALYADSAGIGIGGATGYFRNWDTTAAEPAGIAIYAENQSADATIVTRNIGIGDAIRVLNAAGNQLVFRVTGNGTVRADGSYNCGLVSNCFNAGVGADLAERIDATEALQPGDVVEIDPDAPGQYRRSRSAASPLVAGVVSSRPAITMNNNDLDTSSDERTDARPLIALVGTVDVRASAENGAIRAGDLLVSAAQEGIAMRGGDRAATGTVIGKALTPLRDGTGTVSMLVMLR